MLTCVGLLIFCQFYFAFLRGTAEEKVVQRSNNVATTHMTTSLTEEAQRDLRQETQMKIAVFTMAPTFGMIPDKSLSTLSSWCESLGRVDLYVQLASLKGEKMPNLNCPQMHFTLDTNIQENSRLRMEDPYYGDQRDMEALRKRADRIASARAQQRRLALMNGKDYDAVIVLDIDVDIPAADIVKQALQLTRQYDVLCSNSYEFDENGDKRTYDSFPLVTSEGQHMFNRFNMAGPEQQEQYASLEGRPTQYEFFKLVADSPDVYPVQSCFGGLAIYRFSLWKVPQCTYHTGPQLYKVPVCEHETMNNCLRSERESKGEDFRIGIYPGLEFNRGGWGKDGVPL